MKTNRFTGINLTEEMYNELVTEATELGLTLSSYIRLLLTKRKK